MNLEVDGGDVRGFTEGGQFVLYFTDAQCGACTQTAKLIIGETEKDVVVSLTVTDEKRTKRWGTVYAFGSA